jgi:hypothetical protein|tara:strand:+ start:538 stop:969 length:432 start_codon:yes stop_codon:yes gene_type:complete
LAKEKEVKKVWDIIELILVLLVFSCIGLAFIGCEDSYMTVEKRIIDAENKIPIYFQATAEQDGVNTWRPVFSYYIFQLEEGVYDAYFHAYIMVQDSVIWSGIQPIQIEGGKKIWGEYIAEGANFNPELVVNSTPMAYVSVSYE